jgi:cytolysin-activating lysine-acyltransferase
MMADGDSGAATRPTVSHILGEICWLMSQSNYHRHFSLGDLEWMIMPAVLAEQFRIFRSEQGPPLGVALWANLSPEIEARFCAQVESGAGARLKPDEWKSGDRLWVVEIIAPQASDSNNLMQLMVDDLTANVFSSQAFKFHMADRLTGNRVVKEIFA